MMIIHKTADSIKAVWVQIPVSAYAGTNRIFATKADLTPNRSACSLSWASEDADAFFRGKNSCGNAQLWLGKP